MVYFVYYRITLMLSTWLPFVINESLQVMGVLLQIAFQHSRWKRSRRAKRAAKLIGHLSTRTLIHFCTTLVFAAFMNVAFWLGCQLFFDAELTQAFDLYLWGFVKDIFGFCAASGYMDAYGFECLRL